jgi:hypothetical protein
MVTNARTVFKDWTRRIEEMSWYRRTFLSSLVESLAFSAIAAAVAFGAMTSLRIPFFDGFGFALLILGAALMLVGGALSFVTPGKAKVAALMTGKKDEHTPEDFQRAEQKAALYATTGVILFFESLALALLTIASG